MKNLFFCIISLFSLAAVAQNDVITKHDGTKIEGTVLSRDEFTITFKYAGEDAENVISQYAIAHIKYGKSGREEDISPKIEIAGPKDYEKVIVLEDKSMTAGLKRVGEVRGKTSFINMRTSNGSDKKALEKMKKEAAEMGCQFVLFVSENKSVGASSNKLGGTQVAKNGVGYKY